METREDIKEELISYLRTITEEDRADRSKDITKIIQHIPSLITPVQNELLNKLMEMREIE